jgi:hypothetical protein
MIKEEKKQRKMYSLSPQGPLTAVVPKAVRKIGLVAGAFEAECGAEVGQRRFVHLVAVNHKVLVNVKEKERRTTHISMCWTVCCPSLPTT